MSYMVDLISAWFLGVALTHPPWQNGCLFADDIFKCIFFNENITISIRIPLKSVSKCPIDNKSPMVQLMAWRPTGDMALYELMLTQFTAVYMREMSSMIFGLECQFRLFAVHAEPHCSHAIMHTHVPITHNSSNLRWKFLTDILYSIWLSFNPNGDAIHHTRCS